MFISLLSKKFLNSLALIFAFGAICFTTNSFGQYADRAEPPPDNSTSTVIIATQPKKIVIPKTPDFNAPTAAGQAVGDFINNLRNILNSRNKQNVKDDDDDTAVEDDAGEASANQPALDEAKKKAAVESAANDRALNERFERQLENDQLNDAINAEITKLDQNDAIDNEMRRMDFAPFADGIINQNLSSNPISLNREKKLYQEIEPQDVEYRAAFESVSANSRFDQMTDYLASKGIGQKDDADGIFESNDDSTVTFGSRIKDKVVNWVADTTFENVYDQLKTKYVDAVQKQKGANPQDQLDKNVTATSVEANPLTGLLPRIVSSGFNIPKAIYDQGIGVINTGLKNLGLASDTIKTETHP